MLSYSEREKIAEEFATKFHGDIAILYDRMHNDIKKHGRTWEHMHEWLGQLFLNILYRMYVNAAHDPEFPKSLSFATYADHMMQETTKVLKRHERTTNLVKNLVSDV